MSQDLHPRLQEAGAEAHTNTFYRHFYYFMREHQLMQVPRHHFHIPRFQEKDYAPLEHLNNNLCKE